MRGGSRTVNPIELGKGKFVAGALRYTLLSYRKRVPHYNGNAQPLVCVVVLIRVL